MSKISCAFLNKLDIGGVIFLGVRNSGRVVGINADL
jgi:predicted HTH transcriptional regulator